MRCLQVGTHFFPEVNLYKCIRNFVILISVGAQSERALLQDQRTAEFDSQAGVGGALCLGEMGQERIGRTGGFVGSQNYDGFFKEIDGSFIKLINK